MSEHGLPLVWGATAEECARTYPCDRYAPQASLALYRAIDVAAPRELVYRWLQQLRVAPYSYDWADNFLIPSPSRLSPRADRIEVGQRMMHLFTICEFEAGRSLTLGSRSRIGSALFGTLDGTYTVSARPGGGSRLFVKVNANYAAHPIARSFGALMPWIDLFMMRKQLLRLRDFAQRDAATN